MMRVITKDTDYALQALLFIAKSKDKLVSASELSNQLKISRQFLRKILHLLQTKRILKSTKGIKGGFCLNKPPSRISLIDLIKVFQGKVDFTNCLFNHKICPNQKTCILRKEIKTIESYAVKRLKSLTLEKLLKGGA